ncbi:MULTISPECIES: DUF1491 family protein [unclassified Mesorhizobium]|uniref:DUF1491 family protein n=1 Tax=unclassified Mesorhizobium TaxID=325217 RepID=UPI00112C7588|nr:MULTISPECIES: DUF1491 family protein [unclassified Mesorhizobium]TPI16092.1 DUF1491 family protein [Mesorhizobium sp. B4-1-1]TPL49471.1 DUF1491 family protein [Mesorhizobium sp. B2-4-6]
MRVTADLWVSALVRRVFGAGGFAAIVKRGATEAGAVFVLSRGRMGEVALYGPAPQTSYDSAKPDDRFFTALGTSDDGSAFDARLEREKKFDPDIWVVEIEGGTVPVEELLSVKAD